MGRKSRILVVKSALALPGPNNRLIDMGTDGELDF